MKIIHTPFGIDDPYYIVQGYERSPREPLEGDCVKVKFVTDPMTVGQRAWIEVQAGDRIYKRRAQYQLNHGGKAHWEVDIDSESVGTKMKYRFIAGRGPSTYVTSKWYEYTVCKWIDARDILSLENETLTVNRDGRTGCEAVKEASILTDGTELFDLKITLERDENEQFYGLGEHFDAITIPDGQERFIHVYDQYKVQKDRGYAPVPFIFSSNGRAFFVDTGFMTSVKLGRSEITLRVYTKGCPIEDTRIHLWKKETPLKAIEEIYNISKPCTPPLWALGPWLSANQWNSQKKVMGVLDETVKNNLPATALVIEAWADEQTFYIFNGAQYDPLPGERNFRLANFRFHEPWPDPAEMIRKLHEKGIRLLLWQIPVMKCFDDSNPQPAIDIRYGSSKGYFVKKEDGSDYRIPPARWHEENVVVDFYNDEAAKWWASKREYLIKELGVDGFKTDGGEHLWGRETFTAAGSAAMTRNTYPEKYYQASASILSEDGALFSRAGYTRSPAYSLFWVGDEDSTWEALRDNITAGLNVSISGNPFWGWDIAGFSGEIPSAKLYRRSVELAVFTPIFQLHSEDPGDPVPSSERTPWNISRAYDDESIIDYYRRFASLRMTLSPYIYRESLHASRTGRPLTLPLFLIEKGNDPEDLSYMFGREIVVSPAVDEEMKVRKVILPEGEWVNLWSGETYSGTVSIHGNRNEVYLRKGSIIPVSVPSDERLFGTNCSQQETGLLHVGNEWPKDIGELKRRGKARRMARIIGNEQGIIKIEWRDIQ